MDSVGIVALVIAVFAVWWWLGKKMQGGSGVGYRRGGWSKKWRKERSRWEKARKVGEMGERTLLDLLRGRLGDGWEVLHDIRMLDEDGNPAQIDMIALSRCGVFVIEAKNMHCTVMGEARDEEWTMVYRGGRKEQIENPITQNKRHIDRMVSCLGAEIGRYLHNIVAFADEAYFGKTMPRNVMKMSVVPEYIKDTAAREGERLREDEVRMIVDCLEEWDRYARAEQAKWW